MTMILWNDEAKVVVVFLQFNVVQGNMLCHFFRLKIREKKILISTIRDNTHNFCGKTVFTSNGFRFF